MNWDQFWKQRGSGGNGNIAGVVGDMEERNILDLLVTGEGRKGDGFFVCQDRGK